jgi:hypothetical protein
MGEGNSLDALFDGVLQDITNAVQDKTGWAWNSLEVAIKLHDVSKKLGHWKSSVMMLVSNLHSGSIPELATSGGQNDAFRHFLRSMHHEEASLAELINSDLEDIQSTLNSIRKIQVEQANAAE